MVLGLLVVPKISRHLFLSGMAGAVYIKGVAVTKYKRLADILCFAHFL